MVNLIVRLEKQHVINRVTFDQDVEFVNKKMKGFLTDHSIELRPTNAYTPKENSLVEKQNGNLMNKVRAIREATGLSESLWGEVLMFVVEVDNMSSTKALPDMTPYQKLTGMKPDVSKLYVCRCVVFAHVPKKKRASKLSPKVAPTLFLSYSQSSLGYRLLNLRTGDLVERRDVSFREDITVDSKYVENLLARRYYGSQVIIPDIISFVRLPVNAVIDTVHLPDKVSEDADTLVMIIALMQGMDCRHVNFVTGFLIGEIMDVDIYMEQPEGYHDGTDRLKFRQCVFDSGIYYREGTSGIVYLTVYVDDIIIAAKSSDIEIVVRELSAKFEVKILGQVRHLLGMEINFEPGVILCMSQTAYVERIAVRFRMEQAKAVRSPQMHNDRMPEIEKDKSKINDAALLYREMIGSLQYVVACARPDMANVVRCLGKYNGAFTRETYTMAKRAIRYLIGTKHFSLVYRSTIAPPLLTAFSDADHAICKGTSRSTTGFVLQLNGYTWMWKSKQQRRVTTNTCASELMAASDTLAVEPSRADRVRRASRTGRYGLAPVALKLA
ncbi:hypothetical protein PR003_g2374 [Phytophthora rubi]|uniref:Integrase catalytic domain-containing protein n=1 Tax=Phytophthora rubi TaxID=129364 RepID=A0A6A4G3S4_9STRA|nr:hypothetical protein PR003_g2374 [Phytophthora rubi]